MKPITIIYRLNSLLTRRMKRFPFFYMGGILSGTLILMVFSGVPLFTNVVEFADQDEFRSFFEATCYLLVGFDCLFVCIRISTDTVMDAEHLSIFPISRFSTASLNVMIALCDYRIMLYVGCTVIIMTNHLIHSQLQAAIVTLLLMAALYLAFTFWATAGMNLAGKIVRNNRSNIFILFTILVLFYNIDLLSTTHSLLKYFPLTSTAGDGLFNLESGDVTSALFNLAVLLATAAIGQLALYLSYRRQ